jgi:hypothetical protein
VLAAAGAMVAECRAHRRPAVRCGWLVSGVRSNAGNLGIINVWLAARGYRRPEVGQHAMQFALEPGGTKLPVVDTDAGLAPACQLGRLP